MGGGGLDPKDKGKDLVPIVQLPPVPLRILTTGPEPGRTSASGRLPPPLDEIVEGRKLSISILEPVRM